MTQTLLKAQAKATALDNNGLTPLHYAARSGQREALYELLKANSQHVNCQDQAFWTPLHHASYHGHADVVLLLCENKASLRETEREGKTPLHLACSEGRTEVIKILIDRKAPIDVQDGNGLMPFELLALPPDIQRDGPQTCDFLSQDMKSLLTNGDYGDVFFLFGKQKIVAHRCILATRAPFLLELAKESDWTVTSIDASPEIFLMVLEWLYSESFGTSEINLVRVFDLYCFSLQYKLPKFTVFLEELVSSNIDETNVKAVLTLAINHKSHALIASASKYLVSNFKRVLAHHKSHGTGPVITPYELDHMTTMDSAHHKREEKVRIMI
eukprot:TRINITY_DN2164_c0_g3_i3.p1 TRINITY_DN2164_c0_g3~~TRINITY_DN2164_c0_g3_i3.p1  ORF type:complete len:327 (+),score=42.65 TRINITY_DN2164_c0_g3_i3:226-1206(+)